MARQARAPDLAGAAPNDVARELLPDDGDYRHHRGGEDNGDAHFKNLLVHHQVVLPVTDGRLDLGPWQQVFYCEFDGGPAEAAGDQGHGGVDRRRERQPQTADRRPQAAGGRRQAAGLAADLFHREAQHVV